MNILFSQCGSWIGNLIESIGNFFSNLGLVFSAILDSIFDPVWMLLYYTFIGIAQIANFAELVFKKVAGLDTIYVAGEAYGGAQQIGSGAQNTGGLVMAFLANDAVYKTLIAVIIFSVVLLFLTTIIAIIRAEFSLDLKTSAKGPIIGRALKALVMFFIVPVVTVLGIYITNIITLAVNQLLSGNSRQGIVNGCFKCAAYNANRGRNNPIVEEYWKVGLQDESGNVLGWTAEDVDAAFLATLNGAPDMPVITAGDWKLNSWAASGIGAGISAAANIASAVMVNPAISGIIGAFKIAALSVKDPLAFTGNLHTMMTSMPTAGFELNFYNYFQVRYFYSMSDFDYIIGIGTALVMSWILLSTCLALIKRVFEITILMLLAPPMIALAPLDNGQAQKKWQGEMLKRVIATIGPVFAFNMYFLLTPIFDSVSLFAPLLSVSNTLSIGAAQTGMPFLAAVGIAIVAYDLFMQLIIVIVGLSIVKQASALISNLLGIEDLVKSGMDTSKKAVATAASVASMAFGGAGLAVKGVSAALKGAQKIKAARRAKGRKMTEGKGKELADTESAAKSDLDTANADVKDREKDLEYYEGQIQNLNPNDFSSPEEYRKKAAELEASRDQAAKDLEASKTARDSKEKTFQEAHDQSSMWMAGATEKQMEKKKKKSTAQKKKDDAIKAANEEFEKSGQTEEDQRTLDAKIRKANADYNKETAGWFGGRWMAGLGGAGKELKARMAQTSIGRGFLEEFGSNAKGTSVFAGDKHFDKNANSMWRMVLDNWVGIMGGKEDGAGLIVRRALEKTERARFFYSGKENKQLELKREQGLLMQERAESERKIRESAEKKERNELLKQMFQDQGLKGKDLEEAFFNALNRLEQGKRVGGFEDYKKKSDEKAREDAKASAIQAKIEAREVDMKAEQQRVKNEAIETNKLVAKLNPDDVKNLADKIRDAMGEASKKQVTELKTALDKLNNGTMTGKELSEIVKLLNEIASKKPS